MSANPGDLRQDLVTERVIEDLKARTELGLKKYGRPLTTFDGRKSLQDLYEELLDACQYIKKAIMEEEQMQALVNQALSVRYNATEAESITPEQEPIK